MHSSVAKNIHVERSEPTGTMYRTPIQRPGTGPKIAHRCGTGTCTGTGSRTYRTRGTLDERERRRRFSLSCKMQKAVAKSTLPHSNTWNRLRTRRIPPPFLRVLQRPPCRYMVLWDCWDFNGGRVPMHQDPNQRFFPSRDDRQESATIPKTTLTTKEPRKIEFEASCSHVPDQSRSTK